MMKLNRKPENLKQQDQRPSLGVWSHVGDLADRHKWSIVVGSWATGMAVSGTIISRNN